MYLLVSWCFSLWSWERREFAYLNTSKRKWPHQGCHCLLYNQGQKQWGSAQTHVACIGRPLLPKHRKWNVELTWFLTSLLTFLSIFQKRWLIFPRSLSKDVLEPGVRLRPSDSKSVLYTSVKVVERQRFMGFPPALFYEGTCGGFFSQWFVKWP